MINLHRKSDKMNEKELDIKQKEEEQRLKEEEQRKRTFNGLSAREWTIRSRSVWNDLSSARKKHHLKHGATYPEKLSDRAIEMYSKEGDYILDPFLGTGTSLLSAIKLNRNGYGIELTEKFYNYAVEEINKEKSLFNESDIKVYNGDCLEEIEKIPDESVQLTITSPPYADLIHKVVEDRTKRHTNSAFVIDNNATTKIYSDNEKDFGNMAFDDYVIAVESLMEKIYNKTKVGGYNVWVVKDYRDVKNNIPYVDLHSAVARAGENVGFKYHDLIIWDQNEQRRLVLLGYPSVFYVNQNHSFIVVLRKVE
jgi:DNA modification methylase